MSECRSAQVGRAQGDATTRGSVLRRPQRRPPARHGSVIRELLVAAVAVAALTSCGPSFEPEFHVDGATNRPHSGRFQISVLVCLDGVCETQIVDTGEPPAKNTGATFETLPTEAWIRLTPDDAGPMWLYALEIDFRDYPTPIDFDLVIDDADTGEPVLAVTLTNVTGAANLDIGPELAP